MVAIALGFSTDGASRRRATSCLACRTDGLVAATVVALTRSIDTNRIPEVTGVPAGAAVLRELSGRHGAGELEIDAGTAAVGQRGRACEDTASALTNLTRATCLAASATIPSVGLQIDTVVATATRAGRALARTRHAD